MNSLNREWKSGYILEVLPAKHPSWWVACGEPDDLDKGTLSIDVQKLKRSIAGTWLREGAAIAATPVLPGDVDPPPYAPPAVPLPGEVWEHNEDCMEQLVIVGLTHECQVVSRYTTPYLLSVENLHWFVTNHHLLEGVDYPFWDLKS